MSPIAARALFDKGMEALTARLLASRGWVVHGATFPLLDLSFRDPSRQELRLRISYEGWNDIPPSVELLGPDGTLLNALPGMRPGSSIFNAGAHPKTGRPFICMIGTREYHEHESHVADHWSNYKAQDGYSFAGIVERIWNGWLRFWP